MGKKKKENEPRNKGGKASFVIAGLLLAGLLAWGWIGSRGPAGDPNRDLAAFGGYVRRETRKPLSPALFVGQTARAYQVAWEIPEILDQLYCYCECDKHMGHVSLLSCFTNNHGAT